MCTEFCKQMLQAIDLYIICENKITKEVKHEKKKKFTTFWYRYY